jgi:hypothetical protein
MSIMRIILLVLILFVNYSFCLSQIIYQKTFHNSDERISDIEFFNDSVIYFTGSWRQCSSCPYSPILGKANEEFNIDWSYKYSDSAFASELLVLEEQIIIYGTDNQFSSNNHFVTKLDLNGNIIWSNSYGTIYEDQGKICQKPNGFIIAGNSTAIDSLGNDSTLLNIISIDSLGSIEWYKSYYIEDNFSVSGIIEMVDSSFLISGSILNDDSVYFSGIYIKINSLGNIVWTNMYSLSNKHFIFSTYPFSLNGQYYAGAVMIDGMIQHPFLLGIIDSGMIINSTSLIRPQGATAPRYMNYVNGNITATFGQGVLIIDSLGSFIEAHTYIPNFPANSEYLKVINTNDSGLILAGYNSANNDIHVVKTDSLNNGGCGFFDLYFTSIPEQMSTLPKTFTEVFPPIISTVKYLIQDTLGLATNVFCMTATNSEELTNFNSKFMIYPNPTKDYINIVQDGSFENLKIQLSDLTGRILIDTIINTTNQTIDLSHFSSSIYVLTLKCNHLVSTHKIFKL